MVGGKHGKHGIRGIGIVGGKHDKHGKHGKHAKNIIDQYQSYWVKSCLGRQLFICMK